jgi:hypothetical protein
VFEEVTGKIEESCNIPEAVKGLIFSYKSRLSGCVRGDLLEHRPHAVTPQQTNASRTRRV